MTLVGRLTDVGRGFACDGTDLGVSQEALWTLEAKALDQANSVPGDSGGPMFFGSGPVPAGVPAPSALPAGSALPERRYVTGVNSTGSSTLAGEASLFHPENAMWLVNNLKDFDGDGVLNENDNCVGVADADRRIFNASAGIEDSRRARPGRRVRPGPLSERDRSLPLLPPASACSLSVVNVQRNKNQSHADCVAQLVQRVQRDQSQRTTGSASARSIPRAAAPSRWAWPADRGVESSRPTQAAWRPTFGCR